MNLKKSFLTWLWVLSLSASPAKSEEVANLQSYTSDEVKALLSIPEDEKFSRALIMAAWWSMVLCTMTYWMFNLIRKNDKESMQHTTTEVAASNVAQIKQEAA